MEMKKLTDDLLMQLGLLKELLELLKREAHELAEVRLDAMTEINARKEELTKLIEAHGSQMRQTIIDAVAGAGLPAESTLGELAAHLKAQGKHEISRLHGDLNLVATLIRQALDVNREIAERFAASVKNSLDLLARVINQSSIYGATGGYQQRPTGSVMINREA